MKTASSIVIAIVLLAPSILAQAQDENDKTWRHNHDAVLTKLPREEREKLQAAHEKAMQDPTVQAAREKLKQARKEFRESMHAAMLKADPAVEPILSKLPKHERDKGGEE